MLIDFCAASYMPTTLLPLVVELVTFHLPKIRSRFSQLRNDRPPRFMECLALYFLESGMPFSNAAAAVNALNVEPA